MYDQHDVETLERQFNAAMEEADTGSSLDAVRRIYDEIGRGGAGLEALLHPDFQIRMETVFLDGKIRGSNFLDERGPIAGVGPITVDPASQNQTAGRQLMCAVLDRASVRNAAGVRLLQSAFHNRSLCLYTKLGFETRETISKMNGAPLGHKFPGYDVRPARKADLTACNALCQRVHGHHRGGELDDAITALRS